MENNPDPEHIWTDESGETWFRYVASYDTDEETFSIHFWARDMLDADEHLEWMRATLTLDGQLLSTKDARH